MYAYKSAVLRNIEVYENNPDSINGIGKFFTAYAMVHVFEYIFFDKKINEIEIENINNLIHAWKIEKDVLKRNKMFVVILKLIDLKYKDIHEFLYHLANIEHAPENMLLVNRKKIKGCIAVVLE